MIELRCEIHADMVQPLEDHFCELTRSSWMLFNEGPGRPHFVMGYFEDEAEAETAWAGLRKAFKKLPESFERTKMEDKDWKEAYKEHLRPWSHGRLHWVPSWMRATHATPADAAVIWFDAGLAFGTGDHPTTRLCMEWLEQHVEAGCSVLDYGCGSGILAILARKLGADSVDGVDIDPQAISAAHDNAKRNQCDDVRWFVPSDYALARASTRYDIVAANILSGPLKLMAPMLASRVAQGGAVVLSGILARQADELIASYAPYIALSVAAEREGWVALAGRKE
ncbi:MAG: hypothetical protein RLZ64_64 [Pseudomonadota bacterium]